MKKWLKDNSVVRFAFDPLSGEVDRQAERQGKTQEKPLKGLVAMEQCSLGRQGERRRQRQGQERKTHTLQVLFNTALFSSPEHNNSDTQGVLCKTAVCDNLPISFPLPSLHSVVFVIFFFFGAQPFGFFQWPYTFVTLRVRWEMDPCKRITGGKNGSVPEGQWKPRKKIKIKRRNNL